MGDNMREATRSNRFGYFEDMEFLNFHKSLLKKCGVDRYTPWVDLSLTRKDFEQASALLDCKNEKSVFWGWKDPRATMFMDLWNEINPSIKFLVMFRDPDEVMTSMYREQRRRIRYLHPTFAPKTWIINNLQALRFFLKKPESVAFVDLSVLKKSPDRVIYSLSEWLQYPLSIDVWNKVYRPSELRAGKKEYLNEPIISALVGFSKKYYGSEMKEVYRLLTEASLAK